MVINEVRFAPTVSAQSMIPKENIGEFKYKQYIAFLPPRNEEFELGVHIEIFLFKDDGNLKLNIRNSALTKRGEDYMKGIWHWERVKLHEPEPASLEAVQRFLSEIGYEVHKVTLLEND